MSDAALPFHPPTYLRAIDFGEDPAATVCWTEPAPPFWPGGPEQRDVVVKLSDAEALELVSLVGKEVRLVFERGQKVPRIEAVE